MFFLHPLFLSGYFIVSHPNLIVCMEFGLPWNMHTVYVHHNHSTFNHVDGRSKYIVSTTCWWTSVKPWIQLTTAKTALYHHLNQSITDFGHMWNWTTTIHTQMVQVAAALDLLYVWCNLQGDIIYRKNSVDNNFCVWLGLSLCQFYLYNIFIHFFFCNYACQLMCTDSGWEQ